MGQPEVSESINTAVVNPSFVTKIASGMSKIKNSALQIISYIITNPNDHDPNLGHHYDHGDLEAYGSSLVKDSPTISITTTSSSSTTHFHLSSSQTPTPSRPEDSSPKFSCCCGSPTETTTLSNPMAQAFRQLELGKSFLTFIMPMATIILVAVSNKASSPQLVPWTLCLICSAFVALMYGNLLRDMFPKTSNALEQLGTACIYTSFFMAVGSHLPPTLVWFPLICFLLCIMVSVCSCLPIKKKCVHMCCEKVMKA